MSQRWMKQRWIKIVLLLVCVVMMVTGVVVAQEVTPAVPLITSTPTFAGGTIPPNFTPTTPGIPPVQPYTPTAAVPEGTPPDSLVPVMLDPNDARLASCAAPTLRGFLPYVVRGGDRLDLLLAGVDAITVTQVAALNCIDDPYALPPGAVIWLPASSAIFTRMDVSAEATAEATLEAGSTAAITQLSAVPRDNQSGVTITWAAAGERAVLYPCANPDSCQRPRTAAAVPLNGSLRIAPFQYAGEYSYRLEVSAGETSVTQDVTFTMVCAQAWIGDLDTRRCPDDPPIALTIAYQPFEHGALIWFSDTLEIYVLTDDGRVSVYEDIFREGMTDPADVAPEGLLTPVRGFGQIWRLAGGSTSSLGWATAQEGGFDSARQAAGRTSYTTYILAPDQRVYAVTLIPGQEQGYWAEVSR